MVKSATRTLDILEAIAAAPEGLSHTGIAKALRIPKSSLTGLLRSLTQRRYLELDPHTGNYSIGPQVLPLGRSFLERLDIVKALRGLAAALRDATDEAVTISILDNDSIIVVLREQSRQPLTPIARVGDRAPALITASGKALAAFEGEEVIARMLTALGTLAPRAALPRERLLRQFEEIRNGGLATVDGEWIDGVVALGLPVFGPDSSRPMASLAVALPSIRMTPEKREFIEGQLRRTVLEACLRLGASPEAARRVAGAGQAA
ncbi:IclR family transcriptional regulator [Inquilinus sp. OTU3971]|uniref:IclR family transcriptional regulator n=1 Tax=Inquilinus sp. OTU3971 TaxID=3043855 RepID=UPI00313C4367